MGVSNVPLLALKTFPGDGPGPVVGRLLTVGALDYIAFLDWAPAFAGEGRSVRG